MVMMSLKSKKKVVTQSIGNRSFKTEIKEFIKTKHDYEEWINGDIYSSLMDF